MSPPIGGCKHLCPLAHLLHIMSNNDNSITPISALDKALAQPVQQVYNEALIGVNLDKQAAIFFRYLGNEQKEYEPLYIDGKPWCVLDGYTIQAIWIEYEVGEYKQTKLNIVLMPPTGGRLRFTSGYDSLWSFCLLSALSSMSRDEITSTQLTFNNWRGTSRNKPCFVSIKCNDSLKKNYSDYEELKDLKNQNMQSELLKKIESIVDYVNNLLEGEEIHVLAEVDDDDQDLID